MNRYGKPRLLLGAIALAAFFGTSAALTNFVYPVVGNAYAGWGNSGDHGDSGGSDHGGKGGHDKGGKGGGWGGHDKGGHGKGGKGKGGGWGGHDKGGKGKGGSSCVDTPDNPNPGRKDHGSKFAWSYSCRPQAEKIIVYKFWHGDCYWWVYGKPGMRHYIQPVDYGRPQSSRTQRFVIVKRNPYGDD
jgi:hypothetical protein